MSVGGNGALPGISQQEVERIESRIAELRLESDKARKQMEAIELLLGERQALSVAPLRPEGNSAVPAGNYLGMSPTHAVREFLRRNPGKWFRPAQLYKALASAGFSTLAKQPSGLIRSCLQRLVEAGVAEVTGGPRRQRYRLRQGPPTGESTTAQQGRQD